MVLKIGNASAFWGDSPSAPFRLVQQQPDLDYLTLDYLAEVSLSIMAIQKEKDSKTGFAHDFLEVVRSLIPFWERGSKLKIVTNAGGLNPIACGEAIAAILRQVKSRSFKIGIVYGDDVLSQLKCSPENPLFDNLDSKESLKTVHSKLVTANAYLGAKPIVEALNNGADIVVTGRVADPSLTVAPCVAHYGWKWDQYDLLAQATVAGHLIECGTQATGGISTNWLKLEDPYDIGYPFVEMEADGSFVITKPNNTGGAVTEETIKEQLLYEIGDPDCYLSPDVSVSFLSLALKQEGKDRIRVTGAKGKSAPATYKVSATYRDGYKCEAFLTIFGAEAVRKARLCGEIILKRVALAGYPLRRSHIECLANLDVVPGVLKNAVANQQLECVLRVCVADESEEALNYFAREIAPMVTSGPQGVTGYTSGRPPVRKVFGFWPCLIETQKVLPQVKVIS